MPRFLADENVPTQSVDRLREAGYDVTAIREIASGSADPRVLERAVREGRMLLTFDRDYGELIFRRLRTPPPGIVYFRLDSDSTEEPAVRLLGLLREPNDLLASSFTVVMKRGIRQRPLPVRTIETESI